MSCPALDDPGRPECCHNCRWHAVDLHHPYTTGHRVTQQRGWVCLAPEFDGVLSGWTEHGLCEMWDPELASWPAPRREDFCSRLFFELPRDMDGKEFLRGWAWSHGVTL